MKLVVIIHYYNCVKEYIADQDSKHGGQLTARELIFWQLDGKKRNFINILLM